MPWLVFGYDDDAGGDDAGVLTEEEFPAKKATILDRMYESSRQNSGDNFGEQTSVGFFIRSIRQALIRRPVRRAVRYSHPLGTARNTVVPRKVRRATWAARRPVDFGLSSLFKRRR